MVTACAWRGSAPGRRWSSCTAIRRTSRSGARWRRGWPSVLRSSPSTGPAWASASPGPVARRPATWPIACSGCSTPGRSSAPPSSAWTLGGQPALSFAARHAARITRLVVMNSLVLWDEETSWEIRVLRRFRWNQLILRRLPRVVFRRAEATFLPPGTRLPPALRADFWESFRHYTVRDHIARMCGGYQGSLPRLPALYPRIRCPTLVLWGERDKHFP